jgi:hypothetical protein
MRQNFRRHLRTSAIFTIAWILGVVYAPVVFAEEAAAPSTRPRADLQGVSVKSLGIKYGENGAVAELELQNDSTQPITYSGYSPNSPSYIKQCLVHDIWKEEKMGWCGDGLATRTLRPGQRMGFSTQPCPFPQSTKIGLIVGTQQDRTGRPVWSDAITEKAR